MGAKQSKKKETIYTSDPKSSIELACKDLEAKLNVNLENVIVGVADNTSNGIMGTLFSPRGTINVFALARVDGQDYRVTISKCDAKTNDPYIKDQVADSIVASVCIR